MLTSAYRPLSILVSLLAGLPLGGCGEGTPISQGPQSYQGALTGSQAETSSEASGSVSATLNGARTDLSYSVMHTVSGATAVELRNASSGEVLFTLQGATGSVRVSAAQVAALQAGALAVNVRSAAFASGEVRAALVPVDPAQVQLSGSVRFSATLTGLQLVPPLSVTGAGKADLVLDERSGELSYDIRHTLAAVGAVSIGRGAFGQTGSALFQLEGGQAAQLTGKLMLSAEQRMLLKSGLLYVSAQAQGQAALRGQVLPQRGDGQVALPFTTALAAPVGVMTSAQGALHAFLSADGRALTYRLSHTAQGATAATIQKKGLLGASGTVVCALSGAQSGAQGACEVKASGGADALLQSDLLGGNLLVNLATQANAQGELRGAVVVPRAP